MTARLSAPPARRRAPVPAVLLAIFVAASGGAPSGAQYTAPGTAVSTSAIPAEDTLEKNMDESAWTPGRFRLSPWIGLRDAAYVTTRSETTAAESDDFTVTAGAGLRAYLPTGKAIWTAHALPEYVWWQDDDAKSRLNGRFGLALFGFFNRMTLEASLRRVEQQSYFSSEVQELTSTRAETSRLAVEVELVRRLTFFALAEREELENREDTRAVFSLLDREEERLTAGLRYRTPRGWAVGLGYEDSSTAFPADARNLSHSGSATLADLGFEASRFSFRLALAAFELEADPGSDFGRLDETTGSLEALWSATSKLDLLTYAHRRYALSVDFRNAFSLEDRQGARLDYALPQAALGVFAEVGEDAFERVGGGGAGRVDDVTALGLDLRLPLGKLAELSAYLSRTRYDSNQEAFDREVTDIRFSLELRRLAEKLSLGRPESDW